MSEEKKEESKAPQAEAAPKTEAAPKAETAPKADAAPKAEAAAKPEAAPAAKGAGAEKKEAPKKEKPSNCSGCNKSIKKKRWYYRNGKFYCTKRCWNASTKKAEKKEEAPAAG